MPSLEQHWPTRARRRNNQRIVLHVARADLQNVGVLRNQVHVGLGHDLGYDGQAGLMARAGQQFEAFKAETLK